MHHSTSMRRTLRAGLLLLGLVALLAGMTAGQHHPAAAMGVLSGHAKGSSPDDLVAQIATHQQQAFLMAASGADQPDGIPPPAAGGQPEGCQARGPRADATGPGADTTGPLLAAGRLALLPLLAMARFVGNFSRTFVDSLSQALSSYVFASSLALTLAGITTAAATTALGSIMQWAKRTSLALMARGTAATVRVNRGTLYYGPLVTWLSHHGHTQARRFHYEPAVMGGGPGGAGPVGPPGSASSRGGRPQARTLAGDVTSVTLVSVAHTRETFRVWHEGTLFWVSVPPGIQCAPTAALIDSQSPQVATGPGDGGGGGSHRARPGLGFSMPGGQPPLGVADIGPTPARDNFALGPDGGSAGGPGGIGGPGGGSASLEGTAAIELRALRFDGRAAHAARSLLAEAWRLHAGLFRDTLPLVEIYVARSLGGQVTGPSPAGSAHQRRAVNTVWDCLGRRRPRSPESLHLPRRIFAGLVENAQRFLADGEWYAACGTSTIMAFASVMRLPICILNLNACGFGQDGSDAGGDLTRLLSSAPEHSILVIEDIDAAMRDATVEDDPATGGAATPGGMPGPGADAQETTPMPAVRRRRPDPGSGSRLVLSDLLNALDGLAAPEGRIVFMTTNHFERLDPALVRPGRVDNVIVFEHARRSQIRKMFRWFYAGRRAELPVPVDAGTRMAAPPASGAESDSDSDMSAIGELPGILEVYASDSEDSDSEAEAEEEEDQVPGGDEARPVRRSAAAAGGRTSRPDRTRPTQQGLLSQEELTTLAGRFARALPSRRLSMATVQGFLLDYRGRPYEAVRRVHLLAAKASPAGPHHRALPSAGRRPTERLDAGLLQVDDDLDN
ncbi:hypothetical protein H696_01915 [Fonticula alba]|uniref:Uncharacterized protein n=1 Tax=Fonticula alba TaxID=691883 RepID=A0A058ZAM2_FONAL|nr:hypothetical protein H696_01915 [Fonticula alba]KCV70968.1 hypothetical protein H696_01915 [Fonticula alba]|eukprot:XP_009494091.1 hypothetical protein H696_01915 [Fonticula alba]